MMLTNGTVTYDAIEYDPVTFWRADTVHSDWVQAARSSAPFIALSVWPDAFNMMVGQLDSGALTAEPGDYLVRGENDVFLWLFVVPAADVPGTWQIVS